MATQGSLVYIAGSSVVARGVEVTSHGGVHEEYAFNRAIQLFANATLSAEKCVFSGWLGDTIIFNTDSVEGRLTCSRQL